MYSREIYFAQIIDLLKFFLRELLNRANNAVYSDLYTTQDTRDFLNANNSYNSFIIFIY